MVQGRGNADKSIVFGLLLIFLIILQSEFAESAVYTVGDKGGWTFNTVGWPKGKRFRAGDVLLFKYSQSAHDVVAVNAASYNACTTFKGAKTYNSGNDRITLVKGPNYFICSLPGHCQAGMKVLVNAA